MKEELISFETAKLAKEKGFDWGCRHLSRDEFDGEIPDIDELRDFVKFKFASNKTIGRNEYTRPTQSFLQKWLRKVHGRHIVLIPTITSHWTFKDVRVISEIDNDAIKGVKSISDLPPYKNVSGQDFSTYEEALEKALQEALKLIP